jgi:hypothetical protein
VQLRLLLSRETEVIELCKPGDTIEIVGLGPATIDRSGANPRACTGRRRSPEAIQWDPGAATSDATVTPQAQGTLA